MTTHSMPLSLNISLLNIEYKWCLISSVLKAFRVYTQCHDLFLIIFIHTSTSLAAPFFKLYLSVFIITVQYFAYIKYFIVIIIKNYEKSFFLCKRILLFCLPRSSWIWLQNYKFREWNNRELYCMSFNFSFQMKLSALYFLFKVIISSKLRANGILWLNLFCMCSWGKIIF